MHVGTGIGTRHKHTPIMKWIEVKTNQDPTTKAVTQWRNSKKEEHKSGEGAHTAHSNKIENTHKRLSDWLHSQWLLLEDFCGFISFEHWMHGPVNGLRQKSLRGQMTKQIHTEYYMREKKSSEG